MLTSLGLIKEQLSFFHKVHFSDLYFYFGQLKLCRDKSHQLPYLIKRTSLFFHAKLGKTMGKWLELVPLIKPNHSHPIVKYFQYFIIKAI
jgi:hypothetical protein